MCPARRAVGRSQGLRDCAIIRLASDALLRVGEISALNVEDFEEKGDGTGIIHIRSSKTDQTGAGAALDIGPPTVDAVNEWIESAEITEGPLFLSTRGRKAGGRIAANGLDAMFKVRLKAIGVEGRVGGHSFRRGSCASLIKAGAHTVEIQEVGRWASEEMVTRYAKGQLENATIKYRYGGE